MFLAHLPAFKQSEPAPEYAPAAEEPLRLMREHVLHKFCDGGIRYALGAVYYDAAHKDVQGSDSKVAAIVPVTEGPSKSFLISAENIEKFLALCGGKWPTNGVEVEQTKVGVRFKSNIATCEFQGVIEGRFPDVHKCIPTEEVKSSFTVRPQQLLPIVKHAIAAIVDDEPLLTFCFRGGDRPIEIRLVTGVGQDQAKARYLVSQTT